MGCKSLDNRDIAVLRKIRQHIAAIMRYCRDCADMDDFQADSMRVEATVFNLMQIGELSKFSLSGEAKQRLSSIPWHQLYGMRNRIVHGYSGINMRIVWDTVSGDIPALDKELQDVLSELPLNEGD